MATWTLFEYRSVYSDFFASCNSELQIAIEQRLGRLLEVGNLVRPPVSSHLEDGIFELKASSAQAHARMLYYFDPGKSIIVVVCFLKDQPKVARAYIEKAKELRSLLRAGREKPQRHQLH